MAGIGGRNARCLTTNILRRIMQDEVAALYSLSGKAMKNSTKKSFAATEICQIIFRKYLFLTCITELLIIVFILFAEICKKIYNDVTEEHLKDIISNWLNQANVRLRRR